MYKIKVIWIALVILFLALLDVTVLNYIKICDVKPDIALIMVLFFALYGGLKIGTASGFIAGLVRDIFAGGTLGINTLFFTLIGFFFGYNFSKFYRERPFAQSTLSLFLSIAYLLFYYSFLRVFKGATNTPFAEIKILELLFYPGLIFSLYTAIMASPVFFVMRKIFRLKY